jgi:uncharacterized damage-inducible protein DinB
VNREWLELLRIEKDAVWDTEHWFIPLMMALDGVTAAQAAWQPPGAGNSIWQTVMHLNYYNERFLHRMLGTAPGQSVANNDETFVPAGGDNQEAAWAAELERTRRIGAGWQSALAELTDEAIARPIGESTTVGQQLPHLLMHVAYHTGQIVLLRKQQGSWPAKRG